MAATPYVVIRKSFAYRGGTQLWSNRYHFAGGTPADATHWHTLMDAVVTAEKAIYDTAMTIVEAIGYTASSTTAAATKTYTTAGTGSFASSQICPGDCANLLRYSTAARSTKGHPVYLFNYFHGAYRHTADADGISSGQKSAIEAYADAWLAGFSDGTNTLVRAGPQGASATARFVEPYVMHRDFPG